MCSHLIVSDHVRLLSYSGGCYPNVYFAWKGKPGGMNDQDYRIRSRLESEMPRYFLRADKRRFAQTVGALAAHTGTGCSLKQNPAFVRAIFKLLTGDASAPHHVRSGALDRRLQLLMSGVDHEVLVDMRKENGGPDTTNFGDFWSSVGAVLNAGDLGAADQRRHGEVLHASMS